MILAGLLSHAPDSFDARSHARRVLVALGVLETTMADGKVEQGQGAGGTKGGDEQMQVERSQASNTSSASGDE